MYAHFCIQVVIHLALVAPPQADRMSVLSWDDVERQIDWHRRQVRLCGPLSAIRVLRLLGNDVDPNHLLSAFLATRQQGTTVRRVLSLCQQYHATARLVQLPPNAWRRLSAPCILIVNDRRHALVLESISVKQRRATIWDPSVMRTSTVTLDWLAERWNGDAILFHPRPWTSLVLGVVNLALLVQLARRFSQR